MNTNNVNPNEGEGTTDGVTPRKRSNIPASDTDLFLQASLINTSWKNHPTFKFDWTTQTDFEVFLTTASANYEARKTEEGERKVVTGKMKRLDEEIDRAVSGVKIYLLRKYKTEAVAMDYYPKCGIRGYNARFGFPRDRSGRIESMRYMIKGIAQEGFGAEEFGTAFWTGMKTTYLALFMESTEIDGRVASMVAVKNQDRAHIRKVFNGLIALIKAQSPETYQGELRAWGFQKEKFLNTSLTSNFSAFHFVVRM